MQIIFQLSEGLEDIMVIVMQLIAIAFLVFFTISTLNQYAKKKKKQGLFLALTYIFFIIVDIMNVSAKLISIFTLESFSLLSDFAHIFVTLGTITIFLFYNEFASVSKRLKYLIFSIGIILIVGIIIVNIFSIFSFDSENTFKPLYIILFGQAIFSGSIFSSFLL